MGLGGCLYEGRRASPLGRASFSRSGFGGKRGVRSAGVWSDGVRSDGVPECRSDGVPECLSDGVPECRSAGVPECKIVRLQNIS